MREALGEFEQLVLLAIMHLDGEVYGVPIVDEIERRTGRDGRARGGLRHAAAARGEGAPRPRR